ncbi:class I SAM-dependent methyltransferase [Bacillus carboniphilus]|uniref:Class I SAM-dependent methyltransferase n=1 Tax=Bacillus carboniphilus TaxID=86663 RepID=A0ABY9JUT7_9BACI|nr:class I SAM-dependent methyltransferase [Bacillus carboniphilus]WLR42195.1 class I SAM-dependent methyltransferase [Bacillus carboniphilus]
MKNAKDILEQNKKGWNTVSHHFNGKDALPSYGPFAQTEDELQLFENIKDKKVLEIGYGSGHSLRYMASKGANELWGVDFSQSQKKAAEELLTGLGPHLFCAPMEKEIGLPKQYFDYVYSIYAIGWTIDLSTTFNLIYSYLKVGGTFIFSWDHPLYAHLHNENGKIYLKESYQDEGIRVFENFKGENVSMTIHRRKMATYINELIKAGFQIDSVIESDVSTCYKDEEEEISDRYYSLYKAKNFPATMIIKATKSVEEKWDHAR